MKISGILGTWPMWFLTPKITLGLLLFQGLCLTLAPDSAAQQCRCQLCGDLWSHRGRLRTEYWDRIGLQRRSANWSTPVNPVSSSTQVVYLDFLSGDNGAIDYTLARQLAILDGLEVIYQRFDVHFTLTEPIGDFSTIVFNAGNFGGGTAEDIDFRNLNRNDNAVLNVDGLGLTDEQIVPLSVLIAAHELGHLMGLRHADMFGPIGQGILPGFGIFYNPLYTGPQNAFESSDHVMVTGAFGIPFSAFLTPSWFSERSAVKLSIAEKLLPIADVEPNDSLATAQLLPFQNLAVPNTIVQGQNAGSQSFSVSAAVVVGTLGGLTDAKDIFQFEARAGDLFNMEILSNVTNRLRVDPIDPNISVFDALGNFINYYGSNAFNESELKTPDSILIDLIIPADGTYFVQVGSSVFNDSGNYELMVYRFNGVLGDLNCDGTVDLLDVGLFVNTVISGHYNPNADINTDGRVDLLDVNPFVNLLNGN